MSEKTRKEWPVYPQEQRGYQAKTSTPKNPPPKGGSNVTPPPKSQKEEK